jgi:hypothetical protein
VRYKKSLSLKRMTTKPGTSFRLSVQALKLLRLLSQKLGISQASILELLIRGAAQKHGVIKEKT